MTADLDGALALLEQAEALPREDGAAVTLLEEAVRIADTLGDTELALSIRLQLVENACYSGRLDRMILAFAWCLAHYDRSGDEDQRRTLYWKYKWIALEIINFPHIARAQIEALHDDLSARYTKADISLRPVHAYRCHFAQAQGDQDAAARHFAAWMAAPRDGYSDCRACEADARVGYHIFRAEDEAALTHAAPLLARKLSCAEVPHTTFGRVLTPLLRLGRLEEAASAHRKGIRLLKPGRKLLEFAGQHVAFLALTGNHGRAVKQLERFLPFALDVGPRLDGFLFLLDALLLSSLLNAAGTATIRLKLPQNALPESSGLVWQQGSRYAVPALHDFFERQVIATAALFDQRNGNTFTTQRIKDSLDRAALACDFPLDQTQKEA